MRDLIVWETIVPTVCLQMVAFLSEKEGEKAAHSMDKEMRKGILRTQSCRVFLVFFVLYSFC